MYQLNVKVCLLHCLFSRMTTFSLSNPCQTLPVPDHFILVYLYKVMTTGQNVTVHMSSFNTGTLGIKKKKIHSSKAARSKWQFYQLYKS